MPGWHRGTNAIVVLALALLATPSHVRAAGDSYTPPASHASVKIDGDLADLVGAIDASPGTAHAGFKAEYPAVPVGLTGMRGCESYINGFDLDGVYVLLEYKNPDGSIRWDASGGPDVTMYVGWRVPGQIGDVDGDGDPDKATVARPDCYKVQPGRRSPLQVDEFYEVTLDLSCSGDFLDPSRRITLGVVATLAEPAGRLVANPRTASQITIPGAFAYENSATLGDASRGHALEARIDHLQDLLPPGTDLGHVTMAFAAGAASDGLADDAERPGFVFAPPAEVGITKTPDAHASCTSTAVDWTITLRNEGLGRLVGLTVTDVLDLGLTYAGDDQGSIGDAGTRTWSFGDPLAPGESVTIKMNAVLEAMCEDPLRDHLSARAATACDTAAALLDVPGPGTGPRALPAAFELYTNSPNPFAFLTTFRFALPEPSHVTLAVYSIAGQRVAVVADAKYPPGVQAVRWQAVGRAGQPLPPGVYFYRFNAVGAASGRKVEKTLQLVIRR